MTPTTDDTEYVLSARHVDFVRDGRYLLRDITLHVEHGQHWVLLGANGAGKSTLLSLLGAFAHPTHGVVHVLGHQLGRVDMRELRSHIGHVDPRHTVRAPLTVRDVVLTGLTNTPEFIPRWAPTPDQIELAETLAASLGMSARIDAHWQTLSQGERGRALIARALMVDPSLLLLDEPATGLDLAAREQLLTALDDLRVEYPAVASILVTHHLEEIPVTTTHAMLIRDGVISAQGPIVDVLNTANISDCFDHAITITRQNDRWIAQASERRSP
ncbi:ABC transporter ATP-binding protein [Antrihabitans cavernicola]|uniref:ATP-binding cassette domain-containing protein n=1 Tax=Antrihabitans cavernicola TaxID=2495913 RepID=A0A5A7SFP3_9NOCA|nr:ATP-binding cassette domain-containing protein [Spelaeibacter cavernicola]KAA0023335.1 ATP-binding cassette domain-containing protein [Spelaeibacter cavernicola]